MDYARQETKRLSLTKTVVSLVLSVLVWTLVTNAWNYTGLLFNAQSGSWTNYIYDFFSRLVWAVPAIVYLRIYKSDVPATLKQLFANKPQMKPLIISVAVIVIYSVGAMFYNHGGFWINPDFDFLKHFPMFVMVAFAEELVYRGWGLNALSAFMSEKMANVVSALFFVLLHLPAYFIMLLLGGTFPTAAVITKCIFAFVLGLLFGYLYRRGKPMWSPMLVHFLADFLGILLIG